jgi:hypothetical protein
MTLAQWAENGWLREHRAQREEIRNLLAIADRDILDAKGGISSDWQFGIAMISAFRHRRCPPEITSKFTLIAAR